MLEQIFSVIQFHERLSVAFNAPLTLMDALKNHGREAGVSLQENGSLSHVFVSVGKSDAKEEGGATCTPVLSHPTSSF